MDMHCLEHAVRESTEAIHNQDIKAMLYGQVVALQTMFTNLARRADCQQGRPISPVVYNRSTTALRANRKSITPNELLEDSHIKRLNRRTQGKIGSP